MTNKTKKSKWLKLALISTATISTLATIPAAICAKNTNNNNKVSSTSTAPTSNTKLGAISFLDIIFKLRDGDTVPDVSGNPGATISGQTVNRIRKGGHFGSIVHPKAVRPGYTFVGWSYDGVTPASGEETIIKDTDAITEAKPIYAVFSKVKMSLYFPESTEGDYQWTYDGATNDEKKITVPFLKNDTFSKITCPTPKWNTTSTTKVWDGHWYSVAPSAGQTIENQMKPDTILYDLENIYPGWIDVSVKNIVLDAKRTTISLTEPVKFTATVFPEGSPQDVDWYVVDSIDEGDFDPQKPESSHATIDKATGVVTAGGEETDEQSKFFIFALAKGSKVPTSFTGQEPNLAHIDIVSPWNDPHYSDKVIVQSADGKAYYSVDPQWFYPDDGQHTGEIKGYKLADTDETTQETPLGTRAEFNLPIYLGDKITTIGDKFLDGFAALNSPIHLSEYVTHIGSFFFNENTVFNKGINLPSSLLYIGDSFMSGCTEFNSADVEFEANNIEYIGDDFLSGCSKYQQGMTLPASLIHVGENFMHCCASHNNVLVSCHVDAFEESDGSFAGDESTLDHSTNVCCTALDSQITFNDLQSKFSNYKTAAFSRNLVEITLPWTTNAAFIEDENGGIHVIDDLAAGGICSDDADAQIKTDDGIGSYARNTFNLPIYLNPALKTIPANFLKGCRSFNRTITIPDAVTSVGTAFMNNCNSMKSIITIHCEPTVFEDSRDSFATDDAQAVCYTSGITIKGFNSEQFETFSKKFQNTDTSPYRKLLKPQIPWSSEPACIEDNEGNYHMISDLLASHICTDASTADAPIVIGNAEYPRNEFNFKVHLSPNLTTIPTNFLRGCSSFNKSIEIPNSVTEIKDCFMYGCSSFNKTLTIPTTNSISIGVSFLQGCTAFNQNLTIPANVSSIGVNFLFQCNAMTSILYVNCSDTAFAESSYTCSTSINTATSFVQGIKIDGTNAAAFKRRFYFLNKDIFGSDVYRKLVLATAYDFVNTPITINTKCIGDATTSLEAFSIGSTSASMHVQKDGKPVNISTGALQVHYNILSSSTGDAVLDADKFTMHLVEGSQSDFYISVDDGGITSASGFSPGESRVVIQLQLTAGDGTLVAWSEPIYINVVSQ